MFVYITSENKQRQQLLQRLLGIFPRPNFFTVKTNCCSYPMSFHDKDVNRDRNFKLIWPSTFSMACMKTVGLGEFLICKNCRKFWNCRRKETDSSTFFTSKFDPNRTIARWRYLTTTTRIHFGFALLFKFVNPAED